MVGQGDARSSGGDVTIGGMFILGGVDMVAMLVPEEDEWLLSVMVQDPDMIELETARSDVVAEIDGNEKIDEDIVAFDARTGERLDSDEVRKGRAKGLQQLDEFVTVPGVITAKTTRGVELSVKVEGAERGVDVLLILY